MEKTLLTLKKIIPKEIEILQRRYEILKGIHIYQPIGRRSLSQKLSISEKIIRNETEYLKSQGFILVSGVGMSTTDYGDTTLDDLKNIMHHVKGLNHLERKVKELLQCEEVVVVPGNSSEFEEIKENIGKAASDILLKHVRDDIIIALTGGSTVYNVVKSLNKTNASYKDVLVVPARGSLRNNVEYQANTIVSKLAKKLNADYELLNIPDNLSKKALDSVRKEPEIQETISNILQANIILFGIGNAYEMARRRNLSETVIDFLHRREAVAEALGYYFNKNGEIVYTSRSIGIKLEHMNKTPYPIAVAGGAKKAEAIIAVKNIIKNGSLIIDEFAANRIIEIMKKIK
ncbi:central glycolytic genes regulator [Vallitalea longa]|uniref:Central glycolytic genes regulator n=1 Tax=Vallitalea longa TaxID=2936439 RepID=A0A9W6DE58_9FIRM|nr:sugar-binding domain-containing protein [Vallitalea longa]GKX29145.1 central glycolytic genes regulator [Vallitalea longa]